MKHPSFKNQSMWTVAPNCLEKQFNAVTETLIKLTILSLKRTNFKMTYMYEKH